jgi:hypothetical protein
MSDIESKPEERALDACRSIGLNVESQFIPFSSSRNNMDEEPCLNWLVTLKLSGLDILTTTYQAGLWHCPAYRDPTLGTAEKKRAIAQQCETGRFGNLGRPGLSIKPDSLDVIWSLVSECSVLGYGGFEQWAGDYGFDQDSRLAERTYRASLDNSLKIHAALGAAAIEALAKAFEDY